MLCEQHIGSLKAILKYLFPQQAGLIVKPLSIYIDHEVSKNRTKMLGKQLLELKLQKQQDI